MKEEKKEGEGLQICVRMTDGISFSLSSHRLGNKGLIEGAEAPTRKRCWVRGTGGGGGRMGGRHNEREGCQNQNQLT